MHSGGYVWFGENWEEYVTSGLWGIDLPEELEPYRTEIEACINANIPHGCCGGCL